MKHRKALVWLRRDLRLTDHAALALATRQAEETVILFIYDSVILDALPNKADRRVQFIHRSVTEIDSELTQRGAGIIAAYGDPAQIVPELAKSLDADVVIAAHDDDPYAIRRDDQVGKELKKQGIHFTTVCDHLIKERQDVLKTDGTPYRVFTPYAKAWRESVHDSDFAEHTVDLSKVTKPTKISNSNIKLGNFTLKEIGFESTELPLAPGMSGAKERLDTFLNKIQHYEKDRNIPAIEGTSLLSVDLRFGTISIRECFRATRDSRDSGAQKWQTELIWREFYHMLLANFPELGEGKAFQSDTNGIKWPGTNRDFERWKTGQTGYPLVDAAMRCFNTTGMMHNRLRMVVAMFLTKDLLVDWRKGEQYFAENLLDFELASNNGGWQWSASTGADAQPYFRIFNPVLQSQKFDPEGEFIKQWVPELRALESPAIHWPFEEDGTRNLMTPSDYPDPMVIHKQQKAKVIALFKHDSR